MQEANRERASWGQTLAIASAYAACYELTLYVSFPQWLLTSGLRLACLLLLPMRYWPAVVLGESVPLLENAILCAPKFGIPWAAAQAVPMSVLWMILLKPMRQRWSSHDTNGRIRMNVILWATLGTSLITAFSTTVRLVLALQHTPGKWPEIVPADYFFAYFLGAYLGALTLSPMIVALRERLRTVKDSTPLFPIFWKSQLLRDTLWWVVPALAGLVSLALITDHDNVRWVARIALLWPVMGLTLRHGWHGTALGGMAASIALAVTAKGLLDPETIQVEVLLALTLSVSLWLGARVSRDSKALTTPAVQER
ncbi:glucose-6-phosphate-specific signal transduction histidine kinase [Luteibacter sp. Sphag1AF]|uniref:MASE1 domain-containing protein n=1 Tax=Luteibacter sp. Sphag1AF TaxID=2587031 RepID=UPI00161C79D1|nr:hypothetical protein [Luteibacter sp. Sphag1AF]MBB3229167.1 glucose-6-phosphate-specific signal transduction histidine kinase [Luteibacter sp. Sphag1AF]